MRTIIMPAAISALALLAACNGAATNNAAGTNGAAPANAAVNAPETTMPAGNSASVPTAGGAVDQQFIVGHWAVRPGCSETVSFEADGTVRVSDDPRPGRWSLAGDVMTITPPEGEGRPAQVTRQGETLIAAAQGEPPLTLTRCDAPATPPPAAK